VQPLLGELAALGTAVCWSFTALFFGFSGRRVGAAVTNASRLLFAALLLSLAHLVLFGSLLPLDAGPERWAWLSLSAFFGLAIGDWAFFQALVLIGARPATLLMATVPIMGAALAWILFRETVSGLEAAGIALTIGAVAWVVTENREGQPAPGHPHFLPGVALALLGAFGQAAGLIASRYGLAGDYPALSGSLMRILAAVGMVWGVALLRRQAGPIVSAWSDRPALKAMWGGAVAGPVLGITLSLVAIQNTRIGIASTLMALPPVLLIPIERVLYGHRASRRAVLGTLAAVVGVGMMVAG
jgi:drug/metabolite transporter (DMT)-like permease